MLESNNINFSAVMSCLEQHEKYHCFPAWVIRHQKEVFSLAYRLGGLLGFNTEQLTDLSVAARFHDIGKSNIDPLIVNHDGSLTEAQKYEIFEHVRLSYRILKRKGVNSRTILEGVFYHHENFDGTGYPDKLKGNEIPLTAQVLRIVDSFSAMLGNRPYHSSNGKDFKWAVSQIEHSNGIFYNPEFVKVFLKMIREFKTHSAVNGLYTDFYQAIFSS